MISVDLENHSTAYLISTYLSRQRFGRTRLNAQNGTATAFHSRQLKMARNTEKFPYLYSVDDGRFETVDRDNGAKFPTHTRSLSQHQSDIPIVVRKLKQPAHQINYKNVSSTTKPNRNDQWL